MYPIVYTCYVKAGHLLSGNAPPSRARFTGTNFTVRISPYARNIVETCESIRKLKRHAAIKPLHPL